MLSMNLEKRGDLIEHLLPPRIHQTECIYGKKVLLRIHVIQQGKVDSKFQCRLHQSKQIVLSLHYSTTRVRPSSAGSRTFLKEASGIDPSFLIPQRPSNAKAREKDLSSKRKAAVVPSTFRGNDVSISKTMTHGLRRKQEAKQRIRQIYQTSARSRTRPWVPGRISSSNPICEDSSGKDMESLREQIFSVKTQMKKESLKNQFLGATVARLERALYNKEKEIEDILKLKFYTTTNQQQSIAKERKTRNLLSTYRKKIQEQADLLVETEERINNLKSDMRSTHLLEVEAARDEYFTEVIRLRSLLRQQRLRFQKLEEDTFCRDRHYEEEIRNLNHKMDQLNKDNKALLKENQQLHEMKKQERDLSNSMVLKELHCQGKQKQQSKTEKEDLQNFSSSRMSSPSKNKTLPIEFKKRPSLPSTISTINKEAQKESLEKVKESEKQKVVEVQRPTSTDNKLNHGICQKNVPSTNTREVGKKVTFELQFKELNHQVETKAVRDIQEEKKNTNRQKELINDVNLQKKDFIDADLQKKEFIDANLQKKEFIDADLKNKEFIDPNLQEEESINDVYQQEKFNTKSLLQNFSVLIDEKRDAESKKKDNVVNSTDDDTTEDTSGCMVSRFNASYTLSDQDSSIVVTNDLQDTGLEGEVSGLDGDNELVDQKDVMVGGKDGMMNEKNSIVNGKKIMLDEEDALSEENINIIDGNDAHNRKNDLSFEGNQVDVALDSTDDVLLKNDDASVGYSSIEEDEIDIIRQEMMDYELRNDSSQKFLSSDNITNSELRSIDKDTICNDESNNNRNLSEVGINNEDNYNFTLSAVGINNDDNCKCTLSEVGQPTEPLNLSVMEKMNTVKDLILHDLQNKTHVEDVTSILPDLSFNECKIEGILQDEVQLNVQCYNQDLWKEQSMKDAVLEMEVLHESHPTLPRNADCNEVKTTSFNVSDIPQVVQDDSKNNFLCQDNEISLSPSNDHPTHPPSKLPILDSHEWNEDIKEHSQSEEQNEGQSEEQSEGQSDGHDEGQNEKQKEEQKEGQSEEQSEGQSEGQIEKDDDEENKEYFEEEYEEDFDQQNNDYDDDFDDS